MTRPTVIRPVARGTAFVSDPTSAHVTVDGPAKTARKVGFDIRINPRIKVVQIDAI